MQRLLILSLYILCAASSLTLFTSCESKKTIVNALDEREANEILVFLDSKGVKADKMQNAGGGGPGGGGRIMWDIVVNARDSTKALAYLNQSGLPRRQGQRLLEIFAGGGLVPSELEEKIRFQQGQAEQIASSIRKFDGVLDAQINLSFPEINPLRPDDETKEKITASVYVKHSGILDDPNAHLVTKIKRLVQSSISGLNYDNVTVVSDRARFGEISPFGGKFGEDKEYVRTWSILIAKESLSRFRGIFLSFLLLCLTLLLSFFWMAWKVYPVFHKHGGWKELFKIKPIIPIESDSPPTEGGDSDDEGGETPSDQPAEESIVEDTPPTDVT